MKHKLLRALFCVLIFGISFLQAQNNQQATQQAPAVDYSESPYWVDMMQDVSVNFYEVQKAFTTYFEGRPTGKGSGWKQFKRWENFMEPRVFPTGQRLDHARVWNETMQYRKNNPKKDNAPKSNWTSLGPDTWTNITGHWNPGIGRINVIARDPFDAMTVYIGAPSGGLWKTTDEGENWEVLTDHLPIMGVSAIAIHPVNTDIIYIGTGDKDANDNYSIGVLKSTDGGYTWELTGLDWSIGQNRTIAKLLINPENPDILFAATTNGIYKTTDAGVSWYNVQAGDIDDMEFKPGDPDIVYACTQKFYKSTNGGESFTQITGVPTTSRVQIAVSDANPNYVYFFSYQSGIYRSEDSGNTFSKRSTQPNQGSQGWYDLAFAVSHENAEEVHLGEINTWRSLNGGQNWTKTTDWQWGNNIGYTHCDIHEMVFYGGTLYVGTDGLVCKSTDHGNTWHSFTEGVSIRQFYRIAGSKTNPYKLMGGSQDNGTSVYTDDYWHEWLGADGMECAIDHTNENIVYGTSQNGTFYKSTNGGNGGSVNVSQPGSGSWVTPFVMHPQDPQTLFVGLKNVRKTTNGMNSWTTISNLGGGDIKNMYISESNPDYLYVSKDAILYRTKDGGTTWENISSGLPNLFITYIAVHPLDPEIVAVSLSGFTNNKKVYISYDAGETWENFSDMLPNLPANCVIFHKDENMGIYVGMDVGIFYRDNSMDAWESFYEGLPNVIVNELEIHYEAGKIRAGTYGRGLWEADLHPVVPVNVSTTFAVKAGDDDLIEFGETVFLDIQLKNNMDVAAEAVNMTISFPSQYITMLDSTEVFGTIAAGDSLLIEDAFSFAVATNVPDDYPILLATSIASGLDVWEGQIKLTAYSPVVGPGNIVIDDGGDGNLDPGETAEVLITVNNYGGARAEAIHLDISTIDPFVNISNASSTLDLLEAGGSAEIAFDISVAENAPLGHVIHFNMIISASGGYHNPTNFGLVIGTIFEDFESGDFTRYPWEFDGNANWMIDNGNAWEGIYSARSGVISHLQESMLLLEMEVLAEGEISFYKKVSCENDPGGAGYDYMAFFIDDNEKGRWDGEVGWSHESYTVSAGTHTFKWLYSKDPAASSGYDCAWIDYIVLPPVDNGLPQMFIGQEIIEATLAPDQSLTDTLVIANIGGGSLDFTIEIMEANNPVDWLSIYPASGSLNGGEIAEIELTFNTMGMGAGTYYCTILVTDNLNGESQIPVTLVVDPSLGLPEVNTQSCPVSVYPNPFTNETNISFHLSASATVSLEIYNTKGEKVISLIHHQEKARGLHRVSWNGKDEKGVKLSEGLYFYRLDAGEEYSGRIVLTH